MNDDWEDVHDASEQLDRAAAKILHDKFNDDRSKYAAALVLAGAQNSELVDTYSRTNLPWAPEPASRGERFAAAADAPQYTRLLSPELEAKSKLDAPASAYPTHPGIANPRNYDPRGLLESVVLTDVSRRATAMAFWNGQFKTAADVVKFLLVNHVGAGQVAQAGPTDATAVSGARMVPGVSFGK